jgi:hypothetical protein
MGLTLNVGLTGFPLGIQRIELKVEVPFGGFAGVDRAAKLLLARSIHERPLRWT